MKALEAKVQKTSSNAEQSSEEIVQMEMELDELRNKVSEPAAVGGALYQIYLTTG